MSKPIKPPARLVSNGESTFSHVKSIRLRDNGRMVEEYIERWPGGEAKVRLDERTVDREAQARGIKQHKVKKHGRPSKEDRYRKDPNERFRC